MRRVRRVALWMVGAAAALLIAFVAALALLQDAMIFPAPAGPLPVAGEGVALESIETADGERLAALWHAPEPGEATIMFLHGNGNAIAHMVPQARRWADLGMGFLAPAWRGYPGSTGRPSERGILLDAEAAYDWAAARTDGPLVVYGQSLGSGAAVHVAVERDVAALVLEAPYDSVLAVASARFPFAPVKALLRHPFRSDERIGRVAAPVLIVHGDADRVIPIAHGRALHALAPEGAGLHEIAGADHGTIGEAAFPRVVTFVREAIARRAVSKVGQSG